MHTTVFKVGVLIFLVTVVGLWSGRQPVHAKTAASVNIELPNTTELPDGAARSEDRLIQRAGDVRSSLSYIHGRLDQRQQK